MASAPQIALRDGSGYTQTLALTTNLEFITITGTVDTNIIDIQVSINGAAFVSDPTLVELSGTAFTVPNPANYPDGYPLNLGDNTIALRGIDIVGGVSPVSTATITRVAQVNDLEILIPTGIRVVRHRDYIEILAVKPQEVTAFSSGSDVQDFQFRGFNFYASSSPSGTTGYFKINESLVTEQSSTYEEDLIDIDSNTTVFDADGDVRIRVSQQDAFGTETDVFLDKVLNTAFDFVGGMKFTSALQSRTLTEFITFSHYRTGGTGIINSDQFVDVDISEPLYYVVTGVFYDPALSQEVETPYSQEVLGTPLTIDTALRDLPGRSQNQIVLDFISAVQRADANISLIPGSTTRDVDIDPFASEAERIWFLVDFVHRSSSFLTLLQIDDANSDNISDPVASSSYKQALKAALGLQSDSAVQQLIDLQFDKLAGNFVKPRLPGRPSVGQAVFYTETRPTQDVTIASGTIVSTDVDTDNNLPAVRYLVGGTFTFVASQAEAYYNFDTRRYEITADIVAETVGESGNRTAGQIKNVNGSVGTFQVTNTEATVFGRDRESNADLAVRAMLGFGVDTGTEAGYQSTAAEQVGVVKSKIVKSGDPLMMRDYDEIRKKHIGGKVDIWIQGLRERTITERFAFTFEIARDIRCQIIDLTNLIFRVLDSRVTVDTPITEILDNPSQGLSVRNATKGMDYDLTGVTIIDYQTFQISTAIAQPVTAIDDIITADYRFRSVNLFQFSLQPVRRVVSVVGESSGALDNALGFDLYKTGDPLLNGESTIAEDYLVINQIGGIPSGASITVNDETHVMIGFFEEPLRSIGINTATLRVFDQSRLVEYNGPGTVTPDFDVIEGTATTPAKIVRTNPSNIVSGQTVSVDYEHDENFTVTYVINDLLQQLQRTINSRRHITADALVKQAILNSVDLETTIQLKRGASKDTVDPAVRNSVSLELNQKLIGDGSAQSDLIKAVDATTGVDFQVIPLARMGYADGSRKLREGVSSSYAAIHSLDIGGNQVFVLTEALHFPTTDGGGLKTEHRGVFQDDEAMVLSDSLALVGQLPAQAYIIGSDGASISGYSDDATLIGAGFTTAETIEAERVRRTANHVLVSLSGAGLPPDAPDTHSYAVSYVVRDDVGPHDILASQVEFIDLGQLTLTIRTP